ncbi:Type 1 glutamine amidotransferase-like domain-containing protein [Microbacterium sp. ISL-103]|jgi:dipeptidase E|uniref:Type 1 glutamine amidotransferase-like domain-containing protein n=1 Tax=Microbacterium sp. ISL-103 TaxID=2819156 RepID=UPI001BE7BA89|nr:Type 1 glutamine amidotransferase-like domain-containing protein [Microbacterium sp. ISL-103]MBT2474115.1 Type 1 glutamine amidotransferase-like domain-containing protein [Microbacterium sp. ISL-103]
MKLLLTSGGVTNESIRHRLQELLAKPVEECNALLIPTAQWGHPMCSPQSAWMSIAGRWPGQHDLVELGWRSVGVLELTALPSIDRDRWESWVRDADALLVDGGEAVYLAHWIRASGLERLLPELTETTWVGVSGGSMALTPRVGTQFLGWRPDESDETLGVVDFSLFPHLDYPGWESNTSESARQWASQIDGPAYAIDDQTAISVVDGEVQVISEGTWLAISR